MNQLPRGPHRYAPRSLYAVLNPYDAFAAFQRQYGDPFTVHTVLGPLVLTGDPQGARELFTADPDTLLAFGKKFIEPLGEQSLLILSGKQHRGARKLLTPPFHGARMRAYGRMIRDCTLRWTGSWRSGRPLVMQDTTQAISADVILGAVFGIVADSAGSERLGACRDVLLDAISALSPEILFFPALRHDFLGLGPWARFQRAKERAYGLVRQLIAERRQRADAADAADASGEDILGLLLSARYDDGSPMSDEMIRDQLLTLLGAGHETTAVTLAWALYWLHKNPQALDKLHAEIDALGPDPEPAAVAALPYLEAVCNESMRLYPAGPVVARTLSQPMTFMGYKLDAGVSVGVATSLVHGRADLYPDPEAFVPERFLERTFSPFEFVAFGGGARRSIGSAFALYEMKIVLATILAHHELRLLEERPVRPMRRNLTMGPRGGIRMMPIAQRQIAARAA